MLRLTDGGVIAGVERAACRAIHRSRGVAQRAICISVATVEHNRADIQANIDGIHTMIAGLNADIEETSNNLRESERNLVALTYQ